METPPAEAPQLRQLGVGDIVDRVFALYRSRPLLFLALSAPPYLVLDLLIVAAFGTRLQAFAQLSSDYAAGRPLDPAQLADVMSTIIAVALVGGLIGLVLLSIQSAALIDGMSARYLGREVTLGGSFMNGVRAAPRVILAGVVLFLLFGVLWIALVLVMLVTQQVLVVLAATVLGLVATVYIFASTLVMPIAATLEAAGPLQAIRRSWWLSEGNRWRVIGLQTLLGILNIVISTLLSALLVGAFITDPVARGGAQTIVNAIATIAWAPVQWGTFTVLYYDLRVRREAFDLQLAAEALPRAP